MNLGVNACPLLIYWWLSDCFDCSDKIRSLFRGKSPQFLRCSHLSACKTRIFFSFVTIGMWRVGLLWGIKWSSSLWSKWAAKPFLGRLWVSQRRLRKRSIRLFDKESTFSVRNTRTFSIALTVSRHISSSFSLPLLQKSRLVQQKYCTSSDIYNSFQHVW